MFPQSPAAVAALPVANRFYPPALLNHCIRSYLWGCLRAALSLSLPLPLPLPPTLPPTLPPAPALARIP